MNRESEIKWIIDNPELYLNTQSISLEKRLEQIELTNEEFKKIVTESNKENTKEVGKEILKTLLPPFSIALNFFDWNKTVDKDLKESKKILLLTNYFNKVDSQEKAIKDLKETIENIYGNTLVNKIFQMLDNYPPDGDLMNHLVSSLKKVCESKEFEKLFQDHKFFLGTIEKLSPQALSIIIDYNNWPEFNIKSFVGMAIGNEIPDQYERPFIETYLSKKRITDALVIQRGVYVINELRQLGFIKCLRQNNTKHILVLTDLGKELFQYLK